MARILVVDDDVSIRNSLKKALTLAGHEVVEAENGQDALVTYRAAGPDLVLTDVYMPGTDGIEVCRRIRLFAPDAVVVMLTASSDEKTVRLAIEAGARDFITKPVTVERLQSTLERFLPRAA